MTANIRVPDDLANFILRIGYYAVMQQIAGTNQRNEEARRRPPARPKLVMVK